MCIKIRVGEKYKYYLKIKNMCLNSFTKRNLRLRGKLYHLFGGIRGWKKMNVTELSD